MITEPTFSAYQAQASQRRYSSLQYAEYEDCRMADAVYTGDETLVLCDFTQTPARLDFAANDFERVIIEAGKIKNPLRINFVPYEFKRRLESNGFETWAEFVDYFNLNLKAAPVKRYTLAELDFMERPESERVSQLSKRCAGQSRGFYGEDAARFSKWLDDGNQIILIRDQGQIAGFCCTAVYAEGTTLWLREIAVDPASQGRGYGRRLVEQAISYGIARGAVKGFLAVDTTNRRAISIYEKYGFAKSNETGELQMVRH